MDAGVTIDELIALVNALTPPPRGRAAIATDLPVARAARTCASARCGSSSASRRALADMATIRGLYSQASRGRRRRLGDRRPGGRRQRPEEVRTVVQDLAQAVAQNRNALLALTSIRTTDTYTFTHMVNVSILTMAQARGLGHRRRAAARVRRRRPDARHRQGADAAGDPHQARTASTTGRADGHAAARRWTARRSCAARPTSRRSRRSSPSSTTCARTARGYPAGVQRPALNLATMLTSISDVYDAMRSKRHYQQSHPSRPHPGRPASAKEGQEFDPNLVRRFVQLMGIYPVGTMVRLNTGALAVVARAYPLDPYRPRVRVVFAPDGRRLDAALRRGPVGRRARPGPPSSIAGPADRRTPASTR